MALTERRRAAVGTEHHTPPSLLRRLLETRRLSVELAAPLSPEDMTVQAMDDASPTKWHLAHVTWFFEAFVLREHQPGYRVFDETFAYCFNSYYESEGTRQPRPLRGLLSRPGCERVLAYRAHVDTALQSLLERNCDSEVARLVEIGIQHEQQHQELLLTDILALFAANPLRPAYRERRGPIGSAQSHALRWIRMPGGIRSIGHDGHAFAWDNERPLHGVFLQPFALADRLVTNAEWLEFMNEGGYSKPLLWLSDGWATVRREGWQAPLYWERRDDAWLEMSLEGLHPIAPAAAVCHVSYYEADAFARWAGRRLPTEFEWEVAAGDVSLAGIAAGSRALRPMPASPCDKTELRQMFGDVWQWTASAYLAYPGYRAPQGALGEYNGKFMVGQHVLRGASCVTPGGHARRTYRNFFYPHQRWQFTGVRLAKEDA